MTLRVLLADDQALLRGAFRLLLDSADDITVVGEAANGTDAVKLTRELRPDVVIMDINMPVKDGIETTRAIKSRWPMIQVIGLSLYSADEQGQAMLQAGAALYVQKDCASEALVQAIHSVLPRQAGSDPRQG